MVYAFPRSILWRPYTSKIFLMTCTRLSATRARAGRRSIAAEVLALLEENIPTEQELKARHNLLRKVTRMRAKRNVLRPEISFH